MRCLELSDPQARDPAVVGGKAAGLAAAGAVGLPTLPGLVVPVAESVPVVQAAATALGEGIGRARLAAMAVRPDEDLLAELSDRSRPYPNPLIVRSSSPLEADGTWSGAFSTFHGVEPDELGTAVRGCWGAAFQVSVLDRAHRVGVEPDRLGLAVLVQPELHPDLGGVARCLPDGGVRVTATKGPLEPLMAGHVEGTTAMVEPDDAVPDAAGLDRDLLVEVAKLSRRVRQLLDHRAIEWAAVDGQIWLLQSIESQPLPPRLHECPANRSPAGARSAGRGAFVQSRREDGALDGEVARRVAALTQTYPGRLGDALILPWAVAADRIGPVDGPPTSTDPVSLLAATRVLVAELTSWIWGGSPRTAAATADRTLRRLRGEAPDDAVSTILGLPGPSVEAASRVLANLTALRRMLADRGMVDADTFWRLDPDELDRALHTGSVPRPSRLGVGAWEPFAHRVVMAAGTEVRGTPAVPGAGVGRAYAIDGPNAEVPTGRRVLVASQPLPSIAPLLWNAAGLVTRAGSTAAHLIEFAHSIGVPTVVGCDLPRPDRSPLDQSGGPPLVAVDGGRGRVSVAWLP
jgi:phosphohistidine swiveling domain-containing protein